MSTAIMISCRNVTARGPGEKLADSLSYFTAPMQSDLSSWSSWTRVSGSDLTRLLLNETADFPKLLDEDNLQERHLSLFIHGYNTTWDESVTRYKKLAKDLFHNPGGLGVPVLVTWPSNGRVTGYLPDREDARQSAPVLAELFVRLHEHVLKMQRLAASSNDPAKACHAKISVVAHSMGNYVLQKALAVTSKRLNNPALITLVHQLVMVAADVDNDLFQKDQPLESDGQLMTNLCYRITAAYSGLDNVLGASAGLKHFGKRRLGRSGLADASQVHDNVWHRDVSALIRKAPKAHSGLFDTPEGVNFLRLVLQGTDRRHIPELQ